MAETCSTRGPGKRDIEPLDLASSEGTLALATDRHPDGSSAARGNHSKVHLSMSYAAEMKNKIITFTIYDH